MRFLIVVLAFVSLLRAQPAFTNLAPNGDGSALWFSSALRMKGTTQYAHPKIFKWDDASGLKLYEQKATSIDVRDPGIWFSATAFNLAFTSIDSTGAKVAVTGYTTCQFLSRCPTFESFGYDLLGLSPAAETGLGRATLSANGRFLYLQRHGRTVLDPLDCILRDLATG